MLKIYLADAAIRAEQIETLRGLLPSDWALVDQPDGAAAILTENVSIDANLLARAGAALRAVFVLDTGSATVAPTAVAVIALSNTGLIGVAEHVIMLMLALSRRLLWVTRQTNAAAWVAGKDQPILTDQRKYTYNWVGLPDSGALYGKKIGIIGLGHIGRAVAKRLRPFGMRLLYNDMQRFEPSVEADLGVQYRSLDDLLREADFVTLHLRFQEGLGGNENMFGVREFGLMKPTAYFINTSRGRLVDEDALAQALRSGQIAGAGLDVFHYEPLPSDHPLLALAGEQVLLTPHVAGSYMNESWRTTALEIIERLKDLIGV